MFRPPRGHHQGDIQNLSGSVHIIYGKEISLLQIYVASDCTKNWTCRGKLPIMGRFPNMGRCIISYQGVLRSLLKNVNHQADEALLLQSQYKRSVAQDFGTDWACLF